MSTYGIHRLFYSLVLYSSDEFALNLPKLISSASNTDSIRTAQGWYIAGVSFSACDLEPYIYSVYFEPFVHGLDSTELHAAQI